LFVGVVLVNLIFVGLSFFVVCVCCVKVLPSF